jgi:nucleotide-binding universal stress UspA family protein
MQPGETQVCVLHVVDLTLPIPTSDAEGFRQESLRQGKELVQRAKQTLTKAGFKVQTELEEGYPKSRIVDYAAHWKADLIVVGSHGRKGLERFLIGSVAESVARYARCSVLVVRRGAAQS